MPVPPPTLHLVYRARARAEEAALVILQSLAVLNHSRRLLSRPVYPLHPAAAPPSREHGAREA